MRFPAFVAFFLSGASGLIFQNIWGRMLHHVFGSTSVAISTVITVFMAGLGLGAWVAGRWADRIRHPIITYAFAELGVGLWAMLVPLLVDPQGWLASVNQWLRVEAGSGSLGFMLGRFAFVVPILLLPTTLMGASLPLLARHFVRVEQRSGVVGSRVGVLYAINTFGAVAGVLLSGFVLMPAFGVSVTNATAISFNFLLAAGIFVFRRQLLAGSWAPGQRLEFLPARRESPEGPSHGEADGRAEATTAEADADHEPADASSSVTEGKAEGAPEPEAEGDADADADADADRPLLPVSPFARKAALFAFAASGAAALCYEVVWTRALAMTIGASVYSFTLILSTFLIGIASGSSVGAAALGRRRHMLVVVAVAAVLLVLLAAAMWGVEEGVGSWLGVSLGFCAPIALVWAVVRMRTRSIRLPGASPDPTRPMLLMLSVPVVAALLNVVMFDGELPPIIAAVTAAICVFFALMLVLRRSAVLQLATIQLFIAGATFINYLFQDDIPCGFARLVTSVEDLPQHVGTVQFFMFLSAALCTLPATLGMGAMFPLTLRVWTGGGRDVGRDVGIVYAGNTAGSIVGAWLPGFLLMPLMGLERTLHAGMVLNLALGLLMLVASASPSRPGAQPTAPRSSSAPIWHSATIYVLAPLIPALVALLYLGTAQPQSRLRWDLSRMTLGVFRVSLAEDACDPETWGEPDIVYYNDGLSTTVSVERWGQHIAIKNNGKVDASNGDDMPTQITSAAYPIMMHPDGPEDLDVAVVGFGSGVTVGSTLQFPIRRVDAIELEESIIEASWWFRDVNNLQYEGSPPWTVEGSEGDAQWSFPYASNDRLEIITDDGRNYLASMPKKYDVIISEPSNPWITGVSDLFTTDHFRVTKRRLEPGGIYCQWVQLYEMSPRNIKTIYRTFASQFAHVLVFSAEHGSSDTILLGSDAPLPLDLQRLLEDFDYPAVDAELERARVHSAYDVLSRILFASKEEVMQYAQIEHRREDGRWVAQPDSSNAGTCDGNSTCRREPVPLNTDDNALIEFAAPRDLIGYERYEGYLLELYSVDWPYGRLTGRLDGFGDGDEGADAHAELAMALAGHGRKAEALDAMERAEQLGQTRRTLVAAEVLALLFGDEHEPAVNIPPPAPGPQLAAKQTRQLEESFDAAKAAIEQGQYESALTALETVPSPVRQHSGPGVRLLYAYLLYKTADDFPLRQREVVEELEQLLRFERSYVERHPEAYYFLARAHEARRQHRDGLRYMRKYVEARIAPGGDEALAEPPAERAPTTDEPGDDDKSEHGAGRADGEPDRSSPAAPVRDGG